MAMNALPFSSSSWFPLTDRNPQTFVNIPDAKASDFVKAAERVYHTSGSGAASRNESEIGKATETTIHWRPQSVSALGVRRGKRTENHSAKNALVMPVKPVRGWSATRTLLLSPGKRMPVQTVDATPSNALIQRCFPGRRALFGCAP